jgi:hypothetical protein
MNALVKEVMIETVRQASELSRIVDAVPHAGLRGQFRESFLSRAIRPWLPRGMELGTGTIVDSSGTSRQINEDDIVIYAPDLLPAVLPLFDRNIFLLDAVVAHIEVKSTLSSESLAAAVDSAVNIAKLKSDYVGKREIHAIFAYKSTATDRSEIVRLKQQITRLDWKEPIPPISIFCVDKKECYMHGIIGDGPAGWYNLSASAPEAATLAFISSLVSNITELRDSRKLVQISKYILDFGKVMPVE